MRKFIFRIILILIVYMCLSCSSEPKPKPKPPTPSNPYRSLSGFPNASVIAPIQTNFTTPFPFSEVEMVNEVAYISLLEEGKKEYKGNIDIVDISWLYLGFRAAFNYTATGKIISLTGGTRGNVEGALERAANDVSGSFNNNSRIAIVYITAQDRSTTDYITGELEHILRRKSFVIIDRAELDRIRTEQKFSVSGEVDDNTAARVGYIAGASVVITGRIDGEGNLRRLRLRALDTTSAQVVGTASERF